MKFFINWGLPIVNFNDAGRSMVNDDMKYNMSDGFLRENWIFTGKFEQALVVTGQ